MIRKENWEVRLNNYLNEVMPRAAGLPVGEVDYGNMDCCTFASGAVDSMTGFDPMSEFRGKYKSKSGADRALKSIGRGSLYKTLIGIFGKPIKAVFARRGDVAFYEGCCGVVIGREAVFLSDHGLIRVPITKIKKCFKAG